MFVNPNNPTGSLVPTDRIYEFALRRPSVTVVVDESFIEFADTPSVLSMLDKAPLPNVLIIKSLSKSLGVPGLRLGYAYSCDAELMRSLRGSVPIWNMNSLAEHYLEIILKHRNALQASFARTAKDRTAFFLRLRDCPLVERVFPSAADFLLARLKDTAQAAERLTLELLSRYSIYIKDVSDKFADGKGYLRLAVRLPGENERLVTAMNECAKGSPRRSPVNGERVATGA